MALLFPVQETTTITAQKNEELKFKVLHPSEFKESEKKLQNLTSKVPNPLPFFSSEAETLLDEKTMKKLAQFCYSLIITYSDPNSNDEDAEDDTEMVSETEKMGNQAVMDSFSGPICEILLLMFSTPYFARMMCTEVIDTEKNKISWKKWINFFMNLIIDDNNENQTSPSRTAGCNIASRCIELIIIHVIPEINSFGKDIVADCVAIWEEFLKFFAFLGKRKIVSSLSQGRPMGTSINWTTKAISNEATENIIRAANLFLLQQGENFFFKLRQTIFIWMKDFPFFDSIQVQVQIQQKKTSIKPEKKITSEANFNQESFCYVDVLLTLWNETPRNQATLRNELFRFLHTLLSIRIHEKETLFSLDPDAQGEEIRTDSSTKKSSFLMIKELFNVLKRELDSESSGAFSSAFGWNSSTHTSFGSNESDRKVTIHTQRKIFFLFAAELVSIHNELMKTSFAAPKVEISQLASPLKENERESENQIQKDVEIDEIPNSTKKRKRESEGVLSSWTTAPSPLSSFPSSENFGIGQPETKRRRKDGEENLILIYSSSDFSYLVNQVSQKLLSISSDSSLCAALNHWTLLNILIKKNNKKFSLKFLDLIISQIVKKTIDNFNIIPQQYSASFINCCFSSMKIIYSIVFQKFRKFLEIPLDNAPKNQRKSHKFQRFSKFLSHEWLQFLTKKLLNQISSLKHSIFHFQMNFQTTNNIYAFQKELKKRQNLQKEKDSTGLYWKMLKKTFKFFEGVLLFEITTLKENSFSETKRAMSRKKNTFFSSFFTFQEATTGNTSYAWNSLKNFLFENLVPTNKQTALSTSENIQNSGLRRGFNAFFNPISNCNKYAIDLFSVVMSFLDICQGFEHCSQFLEDFSFCISNNSEFLDLLMSSTLNESTYQLEPESTHFFLSVMQNLCVAGQEKHPILRWLFLCQDVNFLKDGTSSKIMGAVLQYLIANTKHDDMGNSPFGSIYLANKSEIEIEKSWAFGKTFYCWIEQLQEDYSNGPIFSSQNEEFLHCLNDCTEEWMRTKYFGRKKKKHHTPYLFFNEFDPDKEEKEIWDWNGFENIGQALQNTSNPLLLGQENNGEPNAIISQIMNLLTNFILCETTVAETKVSTPAMATATTAATPATATAATPATTPGSATPTKKITAQIFLTASSSNFKRNEKILQGISLLKLHKTVKFLSSLSKLVFALDRKCFQPQQTEDNFFSALKKLINELILSPMTDLLSGEFNKALMNNQYLVWTIIMEIADWLHSAVFLNTNLSPNPLISERNLVPQNTSNQTSSILSEFLRKKFFWDFYLFFQHFSLFWVGSFFKDVLLASSTTKKHEKELKILEICQDMKSNTLKASSAMLGKTKCVELSNTMDESKKKDGSSSIPPQKSYSSASNKDTVAKEVLSASIILEILEILAKNSNLAWGHFCQSAIQNLVSQKVLFGKNNSEPGNFWSLICDFKEENIEKKKNETEQGYFEIKKTSGNDQNDNNARNPIQDYVESLFFKKTGEKKEPILLQTFDMFFRLFSTSDETKNEAGDEPEVSGDMTEEEGKGFDPTICIDNSFRTRLLTVLLTPNSFSESFFSTIQLFLKKLPIQQPQPQFQLKAAVEVMDLLRIELVRLDFEQKVKKIKKAHELFGDLQNIIRNSVQDINGQAYGFRSIKCIIEQHPPPGFESAFAALYLSKKCAINAISLNNVEEGIEAYFEATKSFFKEVKEFLTMVQTKALHSSRIANQTKIVYFDCISAILKKQCSFEKELTFPRYLLLGKKFFTGPGLHSPNLKDVLGYLEGAETNSFLFKLLNQSMLPDNATFYTDSKLKDVFFDFLHGDFGFRNSFYSTDKFSWILSSCRDLNQKIEFVSTLVKDCVGSRLAGSVFENQKDQNAVDISSFVLGHQNEDSIIYTKNSFLSLTNLLISEQKSFLKKNPNQSEFDSFLLQNLDNNPNDKEISHLCFKEGEDFLEFLRNKIVFVLILFYRSWGKEEGIITSLEKNQATPLTKEYTSEALSMLGLKSSKIANISTTFPTELFWKWLDAHNTISEKLGLNPSALLMKFFKGVESFPCELWGYESFGTFFFSNSREIIPLIFYAGMKSVGTESLAMAEREILVYLHKNMYPAEEVPSETDDLKKIKSSLSTDFFQEILAFFSIVQTVELAESQQNSQKKVLTGSPAAVAKIGAYLLSSLKDWCSLSFSSFFRKNGHKVLSCVLRYYKQPATNQELGQPAFPFVNGEIVSKTMQSIEKLSQTTFCNPSFCWFEPRNGTNHFVILEFFREFSENIKQQHNTTLLCERMVFFVKSLIFPCKCYTAIHPSFIKFFLHIVHQMIKHLIPGKSSLREGKMWIISRSETSSIAILLELLRDVILFLKANCIELEKSAIPQPGQAVDLESKKHYDKAQISNKILGEFVRDFSLLSSELISYCYNVGNVNSDIASQLLSIFSRKITEIEENLWLLDEKATWLRKFSFNYLPDLEFPDFEKKKSAIKAGGPRTGKKSNTFLFSLSPSGAVTKLFFAELLQLVDFQFERMVVNNSKTIDLDAQKQHCASLFGKKTTHTDVLFSLLETFLTSKATKAQNSGVVEEPKTAMKRALKEVKYFYQLIFEKSEVKKEELINVLRSDQKKKRMLSDFMVGVSEIVASENSKNQISDEVSSSAIESVKIWEDKINLKKYALECLKTIGLLFFPCNFYPSESKTGSTEFLSTSLFFDIISQSQAGEKWDLSALIREIQIYLLHVLCEKLLYHQDEKVMRTAILTLQHILLKLNPLHAEKLLDRMPSDLKCIAKTLIPREKATEVFSSSQSHSSQSRKKSNASKVDWSVLLEDFPHTNDSGLLESPIEQFYSSHENWVTKVTPELINLSTDPFLLLCKSMSGLQAPFAEIAFNYSLIQLSPHKIDDPFVQGAVEKSPAYFLQMFDKRNEIRSKPHSQEIQKKVSQMMKNSMSFQGLDGKTVQLLVSVISLFYRNAREELKISTHPEAMKIKVSKIPQAVKGKAAPDVKLTTVNLPDEIWIDIDPLLIAEKAAQVNALFTAIYFAEIKSEEKNVLNPNKNLESEFEPPIMGFENEAQNSQLLQLDVYSKLFCPLDEAPSFFEPDSIYGSLNKMYGVKSKIIRAQHENKYERNLTNFGSLLQFSKEVETKSSFSVPADEKRRIFSGLVGSAQMTGNNFVSYLCADSSNEEEIPHKKMQDLRFETAWRNGIFNSKFAKEQKKLSDFSKKDKQNLKKVSWNAMIFFLLLALQERDSLQFYAALNAARVQIERNESDYSLKLVGKLLKMHMLSDLEEAFKIRVENSASEKVESKCEGFVGTNGTIEDYPFGAIEEILALRSQILSILGQEKLLKTHFCEISQKARQDGLYQYSLSIVEKLSFFQEQALSLLKVENSQKPYFNFAHGNDLSQQMASEPLTPATPRQNPEKTINPSPASPSLLLFVNQDNKKKNLLESPNREKPFWLMQEAKTLWKMGEKESAISVSRFLLNNLLNSQQQEEWIPKLDKRLFIGQLYCTIGKWIGQIGMEGSKQIVDKYFAESMRMIKDSLITGPLKSALLRRTFFTLAKYVDGLIASLQRQLTTPEWAMRTELLDKNFKKIVELSQSTLKTQGMSPQELEKLSRLKSDTLKKLKQDITEEWNLRRLGFSYLRDALTYYGAAASMSGPGQVPPNQTVQGNQTTSMEKENYDLHIAFRVCSLWFDCAAIEEVNTRMNEVLLTAKRISAYKFLPLVYQMASRLNSSPDKTALTPFISLMLNDSLGKDKPPENDGEVVLILQNRLKFLETLKTSYTSIVQNPFNTFNAILRNWLKQMGTEHPHHTLYVLFCLKNGTIDGTTAAKYDQAKIIEATNILKELIQKPNLKPIVEEMEKLIDAYIELAYLALPKDNKQSTFPLSPRNKMMQLPALKNVPVTTAVVPVRKNALYTPEEDFPTIVKFQNSFSLCGGVNQPKVVKCDPSFVEKELPKSYYKQLVKGRDDLRQDAVMQQIFTLVNSLLMSEKQSRAKSLRIRTYKVVPFTQNSGVLGWVENTTTFAEYLIGKTELHGEYDSCHYRYRPQDLMSSQCRKLLAEAKDKPLSVKLGVFSQIKKNFKPVFHHFFLENFISPIDWFSKRLAYTRSVASNSIVGFFIGLGDRHASNILIDSTTAEVVHIDLGIAFEQGKLLPIPELIPFRLTSDIIDGFGVQGVEGVFKRCAESVLGVMRKYGELILSIVAVFIHDPLYSWNTPPPKVLQKTAAGRGKKATGVEETGIEAFPSGERNTEAERVLLRLKEKLSGYADGEILGVNSQVNKLIREATDPVNLASLFQGWSSWL